MPLQTNKPFASIFIEHTKRSAMYVQMITFWRIKELIKEEWSDGGKYRYRVANVYIALLGAHR